MGVRLGLKGCEQKIANQRMGVNRPTDGLNYSLTPAWGHPIMLLVSSLIKEETVSEAVVAAVISATSAVLVALIIVSNNRKRRPDRGRRW